MCAWPGDDAGLLAAVVAHYRAALESSGSESAVRGWLERRRIAVPEVLGRLGVGFSDRSLGLGLPARVRGRGDDVRGRLQGLGVLRASGHEHFRGCVTFPVLDADGAVVQLYGRTVVDDARLGAGPHRWLRSPRRGVWNRAGLVGGCGDVVVCGGIVDAVSLVCAGFERVAACDGPGGFDDELESVLVEADVGRVVVAFDADEAGDVGVREVAARLGGLGVSVARAELPCGLGVNDVAARSTQPADALAGLVRGAVWVESTPPPPGRRSASMPPSMSQPLSQSLSVSLAPVTAAESSAERGAVDVQTVVGDAAGAVGGEFRWGFGDRRWRVRGLGRVSSFEVLKVNVLVGRGDRFHVDSFDLYQARARAGFVAAAAAELQVTATVVAADLGRVLLGCEAEAERVIRERQTRRCR